MQTTFISGSSGLNLALKLTLAGNLSRVAQKATTVLEFICVDINILASVREFTKRVAASLSADLDFRAA